MSKNTGPHPDPTADELLKEDDATKMRRYATELHDLQCAIEEVAMETLPESIRRQVIDNVTCVISKGIGEKVDTEVAKILNDEIRKVVTEQMPKIVNDLLTAEYTPVDRYGQYDRETTTFRKELVKSIHEHMVYKKSQYDYDKNAFTKAVDDVVKESVNSFKLAFNKKVDADYTAEVMAAATKKIQERLGLKVA